MALTLVNSPVAVESGVTKNVFAGFLPVKYQFKREDLGISSLGLGVDGNIRLTIGVDLTSYLSVGDPVFVKATGVSGYEYAESGIITAMTSTTIDLDIIYVEASTEGYINYLKNWFLEAELVGSDNQAIKILPFSLKNDGDLEGNVDLDVSIGNDRNDIIFEFDTKEIEDSRVVFKVQYRQSYTGSSESYTLIDEEIVLVYGTQQPDSESFLNSLDEAEFYQGYPFGAILVHSAQNNDGNAAISIKYDELDINKNDVTTDNNILTIDSEKQGFIFANIDKSTSWNSQTEYIRVKAELTPTLPFFDGAFFDNAFFETT